MLRVDLDEASIPCIDAEGRVFDLHARRVQFISGLARSGVHPKVAQLLARHSDISLTTNTYTHRGLADMQAGVGSLPAPPEYGLPYGHTGDAACNPVTTNE
jgi:hypothetical protein